MPGAERLIKHLSSKNVPIAIATGSSQSGFERKTGHIGEILRKPFHHHVYAGSDPEVKRGKPHPDVFLVAAKRFDKPPSDMKNVLVFEDAVNGVKAALAAGMQVVFVPDKKIDLSSVDIKPTQTLDSLERFKPELFALPQF
jgi:pseudouridine-5'-monophosphatase